MVIKVTTAMGPTTEAGVWASIGADVDPELLEMSWYFRFQWVHYYSLARPQELRPFHTTLGTC